MLAHEDGRDSGDAETVARALLRRAATDPEPMLLLKAAEMLLQGRGGGSGYPVIEG